jgi:hypothetical protein
MALHSLSMYVFPVWVLLPTLTAAAAAADRSVQGSIHLHAPIQPWPTIAPTYLTRLQAIQDPLRLELLVVFM